MYHHNSASVTWFLEKKIAGLLNKKNFKFSLNLANTRKVEL